MPGEEYVLDDDGGTFVYKRLPEASEELGVTRA